MEPHDPSVTGAAPAVGAEFVGARDPAVETVVVDQDQSRESRELMEASGEWIWTTTFWCAFIHIWHDDPVSAEAELRPGFDALQQMRASSHQSSLAHALSHAVYLQGRYDEAEQLTRECERVSRANDVHSSSLATRLKELLDRK